MQNLAANMPSKNIVGGYYPLFNNSQIRTCMRYDLTDRLRVLLGSEGHLGSLKTCA